MFLLETRFYDIYGELSHNVTKRVTRAAPLYRANRDDAGPTVFFATPPSIIKNCEIDVMRNTRAKNNNTAKNSISYV